MRCPDCGGKLRVYRTYHRTDTTTRHYSQCQECMTRHITETNYVGPVKGKRSVVDDLTRWGMSEVKAKKLAKAQPASLLKQYCDNLPGIIRDYEQQNGTVKDRGGFLSWVIESRYPLNNGNNGHQNGHEPPPIFDLPETTPPTMEEAAWQEACSTLQRQMTRATYDAIIAPTRLASVQDGVAIIAVKSDTAKDWLENRLRDTVKRALASVISIKDVKFILEKTHAKEA